MLRDPPCSTACPCKWHAELAAFRARNPCDKSRNSRRRDRAPAYCGGRRRSADLCRVHTKSLTRHILFPACRFSPANIPETFWEEPSKSNRECPIHAPRRLRDRPDLNIAIAVGECAKRLRHKFLPQVQRTFVLSSPDRSLVQPLFRPE